MSAENSRTLGSRGGASLPPVYGLVSLLLASAVCILIDAQIYDSVHSIDTFVFASTSYFHTRTHRLIFEWNGETMVKVLME